jgi:MinD-like ATPase involved in chromosome partitioning or flagellar assembly
LEKRTEIIAVSSGKGGTGKTLIAASLGYALTKSGHKVLMIDGDSGTDGLSLFLLGPDGIQQVGAFLPENTFRGLLTNSKRADTSKHPDMKWKPRSINRKMDHGVIYDTLITGTGIYGQEASEEDVVPRIERVAFQKKVRWLFDGLRSENQYDYVIVDTRGGFAFESTDICALADSFLVVTEPDYTSFYQDRNLVTRINKTSENLSSKPLLRAIIVNKATNSDEKEFRLALQKEFPIKFSDTFAVPLDINALIPYRKQQVPYVAAPGSEFSLATIASFSRIMNVVTSGWSEERIDSWNELTSRIDEAHSAKNNWTVAFWSWIKANKLALIVMAFAISSIYTYSWFQAVEQRRIINQQSDRSTLVLSLYRADYPGAIRATNLANLYKDGMRDFPGSQLKETDLSGLALDSINLSSANLQGAKLARTRLANATLTNANLASADLYAADLSRCNLAGAILDSAYLVGADLRFADLRGASLKRAALNMDQLLNSTFDSSAIKQIQKYSSFDSLRFSRRQRF